MGPLEPERLMEKTTGALLPEPIDYETNKMNLALRYTGQQTQMEFAYHGSLFSNNDSSLTWQDPFDLTRTGRMSLEPDNQMHQLSATLGHMLSPTSRLTAMVSLARSDPGRRLSAVQHRRNRLSLCRVIRWTGRSGSNAAC